MRSLELNPQNHEVTLYAYNQDNLNETATVDFKFGTHSGDHGFNSKELEKIGKWFLDLAKEISK